MEVAEAWRGYREIPPPPVLRGVIACLWTRGAPEAGAPHTRVLPDGCVDLIWQTGAGGLVAGPDTGPVLVDAVPGTAVAGVRFLPGAGGAVLGLPLSELRDSRVALADLWSREADLLDPELEPAEALARLAALAVHRATLAQPDPAVRAAALRLADPRARVAGVADELGLSERQLRRRCQAAVGYGPKTLQRVLRLRRFLDLVARGGPEADLARAAAACGYADQPHLSRECARLTGLSPSDLARAWAE